MRRIFALVCVFALAWSLCAPVRAEEYDGLRQQIIEAMRSGDRIDVKDYGMTAEELQEVYFDLYCTGQLPWYADTYFEYNVGPDGIVAYFMPRGSEALRYDEARYEQKMAELIAATCAEGMPQWQMALNVHDYIIANCTYDESWIRNSGYQALVNGTSACFGYAQLYMDVMRRVGIPCQIVMCDDTGDGQGHAWNAVELDGVWYHVDLTWDDPVSDVYGRVLHDHFLKSDSQFRSPENGHDFEWETDLTCTGGVYSNGMFWEDQRSRIPMDGETLYLRRMDDERVYLYARDRDTGAEILLFDYEREPQNFGTGWYIYNTMGLSLWNGRLYFASEDTVWSMAPDGSGRREEYSHMDGETCIIGCHVNDGTMYLELTDETLESKDLVVPLENAQHHVHSYTESVVPATCVREGYTEGVCECGISYRAEATPMTDHDLTETTLADGTVRRSCTQCDYVTDEEPSVPATEPAPTVSAKPAEPKKEIPWRLIVLAAATGVVVLLIFGKRR